MFGRGTAKRFIFHFTLIKQCDDVNPDRVVGITLRATAKLIATASRSELKSIPAPQTVLPSSLVLN